MVAGVTMASFVFLYYRIRIGMFEHVYDHQPGNCKKYESKFIYIILVCTIYSSVKHHHDTFITMMPLIQFLLKDKWLYICFLSQCQVQRTWFCYQTIKCSSLV